MTTASERERLAVLETKVIGIHEKLDNIEVSLKELIALKHGARGIVWLIGIFGLASIVAGAKAFWQWLG